MLIFSFGSGFVLETNNTAYLEQIAGGFNWFWMIPCRLNCRPDVAYAHARGIEVGGYDLICLDRGYNGYGGNVGDQWDVVESNGAVRFCCTQLGDAC